MENSYLIPANSKKGNLMFSLFRPLDLAIFLAGVATTLILLTFVKSDNTFLLFVTLGPAVIGASLVMPVPNQHNVLTLLGAIFKFLTTQQRYKWKGWSIYESFR